MKAVATLALLLAVATARAREVPWIVRDGDFADADWTMTVENHGTGDEPATATAERVPDGGRPGAFRSMTHLLPSLADLRVFHVYGGTGAVYDPSVEGAIGGIDFAEDRSKDSPLFIGPPVTAGSLLVQAGRRWVYDAGDLGAFNNVFWRHVAARCLQAADFRSDDTPAPPDFSAAGAPIQFGFFRGGRNDEAFEAPTLRMTHDVDDWRVVVHPVPDSTCSDAPACVTDADCDDFDPCTRDACVGTICVATGDVDGVAGEMTRLSTLLRGRPCDQERLPRRLRKKAQHTLAAVRRRLLATPSRACVARVPG